MTEEAKTYVFGNSDSMAPLMAAMNNGGFGGNAWWPLIFLFALWGGNGGWGGNGARGTETILQTLNGDQGRDMIMSAIQGNATAISQLASTVGCDISAVQSALTSIQGSICQLGNTVGLSGQQIINAIQAGDASLASKLSECCCSNKLLVTEQGYQNRLALQEQTTFLGAKLDNQTNVIVDKFCDLEKRELQGKIDTLMEKNSQLQSTLDNANQTSQILTYINSVVSPIAADVASIKCAQPATVTLPYSPATAVPTCVAAAYGLNGYGSFGFPGGPYWG